MCNYKLSWLCLGCFLLILFGAGQGWSQATDESTLFSDPTQTLDTSPINSNIAELKERESVNFSGTIFSQNIYTMQRSWLQGGSTWSKNSLYNYNQANIFLDIRQQKGFKTFLNLEVANAAQNNLQTQATGNVLASVIKEFFVDMNFNRVVYLRTGKQVLQWGRTYFWNPTDLINSDKHNFYNMNLYRTGAYGAKVHVPFGASQNFYMFYDFTKANNLDEIAVAAKAEILVNNLELAVSGWQKKNCMSVYGLDFSTNLEKVDVKGELALSYGDNKWHLKDENGVWTIYRPQNEWVSKFSLGLTKYFDWELKDRVSVIGEFFYNGSGYQENLFKDPAKMAFLIQNQLYEPNYHGRYYGTLFSSINRFPLNEMNVNMNVLSNLGDGSYVLTTGLNYVPINNFSIDFRLHTYGGPDQAEYTFAGNGLAFDVLTTINF